MIMNYDVYQAFFIFRATTTAQVQSTFFFFYFTYGTDEIMGRSCNYVNNIQSQTVVLERGFEPLMRPIRGASNDISFVAFY